MTYPVALGTASVETGSFLGAHFMKGFLDGQGFIDKISEKFKTIDDFETFIERASQRGGFYDEDAILAGDTFGGGGGMVSTEYKDSPSNIGFWVVGNSSISLADIDAALKLAGPEADQADWVCEMVHRAGYTYIDSWGKFSLTYYDDVDEAPFRYRGSVCGKVLKWSIDYEDRILCELDAAYGSLQCTEHTTK